MFRTHHHRYLPMAPHLRVLTAQAGYAIDSHALGLAAGSHAAAVEQWVRTGAGHAAATQMLHLLDTPIEILEFRTAAEHIATTDEDLARLASLRQRRSEIVSERDQAWTAFTEACKALYESRDAALLREVGQELPDAEPSFEAHRRAGLAAALDPFDLIEVIPDDESEHTTYQAYRGEYAVEVVVDPLDEPGVDVQVRDEMGATHWIISCDPYTPPPVIAAAVAEALNGPVHEPYA